MDRPAPLRPKHHIKHSHHKFSIKAYTKQSTNSSLTEPACSSTNTSQTSTNSTSFESYVDQNLVYHIAKKKRQTLDLWGVGSHLPRTDSEDGFKSSADSEIIRFDEIARWLKERSKKKDMLSEGPWCPLSIVEVREQH
ncbi:hypothetical protein H2200_005029 [Cladophialophora chaetospira]|uniref:Uncharacterized protein n=1 Tax=Cladophialophora chaetospira TaxID=386627 RepID=A0AA38XBF2_9EURO|nr:hypothetical protein H2200_005029 [Cladophialophora chaetospira]